MDEINRYGNYIEAIKAGESDHEALIGLFFLRGMDDGFMAGYSEEERYDAGKMILRMISDTDSICIIDILDRHSKDIQPVVTSGIPQFSEFTDADRVLRILLANEGCDFEYIGYMFNKNAQESAQYKYGENHYKLCYQLGLVEWAGKARITKATKISRLGAAYLEYDDESRETLQAKLCFRLPVIQRQLTEAKHGSVDGLQMLLDAGLSRSTAIRRRSSMRQMLRAISRTLPKNMDYTRNIEWF